MGLGVRRLPSPREIANRGAHLMLQRRELISGKVRDKKRSREGREYLREGRGAGWNDIGERPKGV